MNYDNLYLLKIQSTECITKEMCRNDLTEACYVTYEGTEASRVHINSVI